MLLRINSNTGTDYTCTLEQQRTRGHSYNAGAHSNQGYPNRQQFYQPSQGEQAGGVYGHRGNAAHGADATTQITRRLLLKLRAIVDPDSGVGKSNHQVERDSQPKVRYQCERDNGEANNTESVRRVYVVPSPTNRLVYCPPTGRDSYPQRCINEPESSLPQLQHLTYKYGLEEVHPPHQ